MEQQKQTWTDRIINSGAELRSIEPPAHMADRVLAHIGSAAAPEKALVSPIQVRFAMAAVAAFVLLNIGVLTYSNLHVTAGDAPRENYLQSYNLNLY